MKNSSANDLNTETLYSLLLVVMIPTLLFLGGCSKSSDIAPQPPAASIVISSFSPANGVAGTTVVITGSGFNNNAASNNVSFNGVPANITAASTTSLTVTVPAAATTGNITVSTGALSTTSANVFTVGTSLAINSFSPAAGDRGTVVVISGAGFSSNLNSNIVTFNRVPAVVSAASATSLTVTVPATATTGKIAVTIASSTATSADNFTITFNDGKKAYILSAVQKGGAGPDSLVFIYNANQIIKKNIYTNGIYRGYCDYTYDGNDNISSINEYLFNGLFQTVKIFRTSGRMDSIVWQFAPASNTTSSYKAIFTYSGSKVDSFYFLSNNNGTYVLETTVKARFTGEDITQTEVKNISNGNTTVSTANYTYDTEKNNFALNNKNYWLLCYNNNYPDVMFTAEDALLSFSAHNLTIFRGNSAYTYKRDERNSIIEWRRNVEIGKFTFEYR